MVIDLNLLGVMSLLAALGFIGNSYAHYGRHRGWPVGNAFSGGAQDRFTLVNASVIFVPVSFGLVWYDYGVWLGIGVVIGGYALAWVLTVSLRQHVQTFWFLALTGLVVWGVLKRAL